jgi:predicted Zn-dependent protease
MAALENLPDDPALLITLAKLELQEGRTAEAESWLDRALKADPYETEAEYTLYLCFQREGRQDRAAAALARYEKHKFLLERANKLLKDEVGRSPSDPSAPSEAGDALLHIGQERLGLYWLQEALKRDPNHQPSHRVLAEYYESKGDKEKAAAHRSRLTQSSRKEAAP